MGVDAVGGSAFETARMMQETQISLQKKAQEMAQSEVAAVIKMVSPAHLGSGVDVSA